MTWAAQRGETEITRMLRSAGAEAVASASSSASVDSHKTLTQAIEAGIAAAQASGPQFVKRSGCISCHHQTLPAIATAPRKRRAFISMGNWPAVI